MLRCGRPGDAGDGVSVGFVERFSLEQRLGKMIEPLTVVGERALRLLSALGEDASDFIVDQLERVL